MDIIKSVIKEIEDSSLTPSLVWKYSPEKMEWEKIINTTDMITPEKMIELGIEPSSNHIGEMFMLDIPNYKFKDRNVWISQYDYQNNESLVYKDMWCVFGYIRKNDKKKSFITYLTKEFIEDAECAKAVVDSLFEDLYSEQ